MMQFVRSPESVGVQNRAWLDLMKSTIKLALDQGWTDSRSLAIATGIANSIGGGGFRTLARRYSWEPEQVLAAYVGGDAHRQRRRDSINVAFPR